MKNKSHVPWVEKHRPKSIDDLILDESSRRNVEKMRENREIFNMIIVGPPGTGKTTTVKCLARELFGKHVAEGVKEVNASDERGVKTVQDTFPTFCKKKFDVDDAKNKYSHIKIIIMDEADSMTPKAQSLINSLMEKHSDTTRFAFTCNNSSEIIESIQTRCIIMRYLRLTSEQMIPRMARICTIEKVEYDEKALKEIAEICHGDLRNAINTMQLIFNNFGKIKCGCVYATCDKPQPEILHKIFESCIKKDVKTAIKLGLELTTYGYLESDIVLSMIHILRMQGDKYDEAIKIKFMDILSYSAYVISKGMDSKIQLTSCIAKMIDSIKKN